MTFDDELSTLQLDNHPLKQMAQSHLHLRRNHCLVIRNHLGGRLIESQELAANFIKLQRITILKVVQGKLFCLDAPLTLQSVYSFDGSLQL